MWVWFWFWFRAFFFIIQQHSCPLVSSRFIYKTLFSVSKYRKFRVISETRILFTVKCKNMIKHQPDFKLLLLLFCCFCCCFFRFYRRWYKLCKFSFYFLTLFTVVYGRWFYWLSEIPSGIFWCIDSQLI